MDVKGEKMEWKLVGKCIILYVLALVLPQFPAYADMERKTQPDAPNLNRGKMMFVKYCAGCHGPSGRGDGYILLGPSPADFTSFALKQKSDADLLKTIHEGKPNIMPAWNFRLSEKDTRDVLEYIRTLAEQ
jgi:mono/diheme cytochrome c family protein